MYNDCQEIIPNPKLNELPNNFKKIYPYLQYQINMGCEYMSTCLIGGRMWSQKVCEP